MLCRSFHLTWFAICVFASWCLIAQVAANVDYTNAYYGADKPAGECVLYPNGEVDPCAAPAASTDAHCLDFPSH